MVSLQTTMNTTDKSETELEIDMSCEDFHPLTDKWCLWAHLPHDTNWNNDSYKKVYTMKNVEETIALTETLPDILVKNCMLFLMKEGINPTWEDKRNRKGGCFSYKITNKDVYEVWKKLTYVVVGNTVSKNKSFVDNVNGITISPKKNFCIIKIWMSNCENQNPMVVTNEIKGLEGHGCLFKKHTPEY